jgi:hypothetical protein
MSDQYVVVMRAEGTAGPMSSQSYRAGECVQVRERTTGVLAKIRANEISPYRHTLFLNGRPYQIMNVVRKKGVMAEAQPG